MDIDIKLGREVEGAGAIVVPPTCKKASRRHATLHWHDGVMTVEDNESANGTFVNGKRIAKTKVTEDDTLILGGIGGGDCYRVNLKKVFASCRDTEFKARTDFSKEFETLKQTYIDYQTEVAELKKKSTMKSQLPLRIVSFIPTLIGAVIALNPKADPTTRITVVSVGGAITGLINILMMGKSSGSSDKLKEEITELEIEYQKKYKCPKCGKTIPLTTHWKKLHAEGKCPNPKCDALFVAKNEE